MKTLIAVIGLLVLAGCASGPLNVCDKQDTTGQAHQEHFFGSSAPQWWQDFEHAVEGMAGCGKVS